jgi:cyclopropane-fatty-acyl-phospholipid synthase
VNLESLVESRIGGLPAGAADVLAVVLPGGRRIGPDGASVILRLRQWAPLLALARGQIGRLAADFVEGRLDIEGPMRAVMDVAAGLVRSEPTGAADAGLAAQLLSWWRHRPHLDVRQVQHHYDVSDDFYALWLDPRRVYSCAYYREAGLTLAQAQEAKLEHICRKLMLKPGERFLDIGAGWGGLLLWAAEHCGVEATGITLSRNQHAHVNALIEQRGLRGRVRMLLLDYRDLPEDEPFDKIASIGMFEHVGRARLPAYFAKVARLLAAGRPAAEPRHHGRRHAQRRTRGRHRRLRRALHLPRRRAAAHLACAGRDGRAGPRRAGHREPAAALRAHVVGLVGWAGVAARERAPRDRRTHRAGLPPLPGRQRDGLRARLDGAAPDAGRAPERRCRRRPRPRRTIGLPLQPRLHVPARMIYKFKSKAAGDLIMLGPDGDQLLRLIGREPQGQGIIEPPAMPAALRSLEAAVAEEAARKAADKDDDEAAAPRRVSLRQRVWPMVEMLRRAQAAGEPVVWGV